MDYYTALRRETVKSARFDPLIFLYAHLGDEGAFDGHVFSPNLKNVPVLMCLTNDDHISLSITEWYDEISVFDKHTSTAHSMPVENGELLWEFDGDAWERSDYMPDQQPSKGPLYAALTAALIADLLLCLLLPSYVIFIVIHNLL